MTSLGDSSHLHGHGPRLKCPMESSEWMGEPVAGEGRIWDRERLNVTVLRWGWKPLSSPNPQGPICVQQ